MRGFLALLLAVGIVAGCQQERTSGTAPADAERIHSLLSDLAAEDETVWRQAYQQVVKIGKPAVPFLAEALDDPGKNVRWRATQALGEIGGPEVIPPLLVALEDNDLSVLSAAAYHLQKCGGGNPEVVVALKGRLHDPDPVVVYCMILGMRDCGETGYRDDDGLVDALCKHLKSADQQHREYAILSLGIIGSRRACVPLVELIADTKTKSNNMRSRAGRALAEIGSDDAVPLLFELVKDDDQEKGIRIVAAKTLGNIGSHDAMPLFLELLEDEHQEGYIWLEAGKALAKFGDTSINESVLPLTKSRHKWLRRAAVVALGFPGNVSALERLIEIARDEKEDLFVREPALISLGQIGDARAVDVLGGVLLAEDYSLRRAAARALGEIKSSKAVPALLDALNDSDVRVVMEATRSLAKISDKKAAPGILELFDRENALEVGDAAIETGNLATVAYRALLELMKDEAVPTKLEYVYSRDELKAARKAWRAVIKKSASE